MRQEERERKREKRNSFHGNSLKAGKMKEIGARKVERFHKS